MIDNIEVLLRNRLSYSEHDLLKLAYNEILILREVLDSRKEFIEKLSMCTTEILSPDVVERLQLIRNDDDIHHIRFLPEYE